MDYGGTKHMDDTSADAPTASQSTNASASVSASTSGTANNGQAVTLQDRAMLASLKISAWSARKHDKRITKDVADRENASADVGRYNKRLLPKEALKFIQAKASEARLEHYKMTLPWSNDGARILSADGYLKYHQRIRELRSDFNKAADDFADQYAKFVDDAKKVMGTLYNPEDYPSEKDIRKKFSMELRILPFPMATDFRANLPLDELALVKKSIEEDVKQAMESAQRDVYERARAVLQHMVDKLTSYQLEASDDKPKSIFRNSLITNIRDLAEIMPSLNVLDDKNIDDLASSLESLSDLSPDELRHSKRERNAAIEEANAILSRVSDYLQ